MSDYGMSARRTNVLAMILAVPLYMACVFPIWRVMPEFSLYRAISSGGWAAWLLILVSLPVHEYLHVAGFRIFGKVPARSTRVGFSWRGLVPYAHCSASMKAHAYRIATTLPASLLGGVPYIVGVVARNKLLAAFGMLNVLFSVGDLIVLFAIRKVDGQALVLDHDRLIGCRVVDG